MKAIPVPSKKAAYLKNAERLKIALRSGQVREARLYKKYFVQQGFDRPETIEDCKTLTNEINKIGG